MNTPSHTSQQASGTGRNREIILLSLIALFGVSGLLFLHLGKRDRPHNRAMFLVSAGRASDGDATLVGGRRLHPYLSQTFMNNVYPLVNHLLILEDSINTALHSENFSHRTVALQIRDYGIATREFARVVRNNSHGDADLRNITIYPQIAGSNPHNYHTFGSFLGLCRQNLADFGLQLENCTPSP